MTISDFRVEPADFIADFDDLRAIREEVFIIEQKIPEDIEFDGIDPICYHFIARDVDHSPIGTIRLNPDGTIGRMAVLSEWRNHGVGKSLLVNVIDKARKLGLTELRLNAQVAVVSFYEKFSFVQQSEVFNVANIPHRAMQLTITPVENFTRPAPKPLETSVPAVKVNSIEEITANTIQLINNAGRQICIYTLDLEYDLYGQASIISALKQFAISTRGEKINIIIHDIQAVQSQAHPIFELAQRLPSSFIFRTPVETEDLKFSSAYVATDRGGYLFRVFNNRYQGDWSPNLPARSRQLNEEFDRVWQRCRPCTEFRALGI